MIPNFEAVLGDHKLGTLTRSAVTTLQVNVGKRCNLACHHCHVDAGPKRTESMGACTAQRILDLLERNPRVEALDLTGGAPELNPHFRFLVRGARALGRHVIDRCNLTILFEPGQEDTGEFLAAHEVDVVASLPCYTKENVEKQRGRNVFDRSIEALRGLNRLGYGRNGSRAGLDLVYNPLGPTLPPPQKTLEEAYRQELESLFGVEFNRLLTVTNMPIKRFAQMLTRAGQQEAYLSLLVNHFNPEVVPALMCRSLLSVGYDGQLYDCDFNQMLEIPLAGKPRTVWEIDDLAELDGAPIATDVHCFGCTAGSGSSCGGALK
jgi:radical SAM/Cys-rich protein